MKSLDILIIEDDPIYALDLEVKLKEMGDHRISISDSISPAKKIYEEQNIDLVLLDLKLKDGEDGMSFFDHVSTLYTPVIIITAYNDPILFDTASGYAPSAYLVKPFNLLTLRSLIENVINTQLNTLETLFIRYKGKITKIPIKDICYLNSESNYTHINTDSEKYVVRKSLTKVISELNSDGLQQIHRRYVVNVQKIQSILLKANKLVVNEQELPIGRLYKKDLQKKLNIV